MIPQNRQDLGNFGEALVANRLRNLGRCAKQYLPFAGDLDFDGVKVEVKTARLGCVNATSRGWQFCLRRATHCDVGYSDVLVCVGLGEIGEIEGIWVIPVNVLGESRRKINIKRNTSTKWDYWRNRWDVLGIEGVTA